MPATYHHEAGSEGARQAGSSEGAANPGHKEAISSEGAANAGLECPRLIADARTIAVKPRPCE